MVGVTALLSQQGRVDRAFERIYRRHVGDVYRYALAVLRNPADAEDVTQTTFMNAYRAFLRGERPRNAQNWLIAITHNVCRQRFRQSLRRPEEVEYDEGIGEVGPDEEEGPSAEDIQRALGQLAFNQRAALVMRELEGRSYAEIAEILGTSVSAVETLIFRARRALREQLGGSLTCGEAERAISRDLDGRLSRAEKSALRGHVRACKECQRFARSQRAQRRAIKALGVIPIPASLTSLFGGGGGAAAVGGGVAIKAAAVVAAGTVATGVGYEGVKRFDIARDTPERAAEVGAATPDAAIRAARPVALVPPFAVSPAPEQKAKASVRSKAKAKPAKAKVSRRTAPKTPPGLTKKAVRAVPKAKAKAPSAKAKGPKLQARVPRRAKPVQVKPARRVKAPVAKPKAVPPAKPGKRSHVR
jgi:RNA polymerase sigma-70 factor, ECF subfamily